LNGLKDYGVTAPKVVVYRITVQLLGWLYEQFLISEILTPDEIGKYVIMFHSTTFDDEKEKL